MKTMFKTIFCLTLAVVVTAHKNVLFIAVDDMRPEIGAFGVPGTVGPKMITPNMDRIAGKSLLMKNAQCQQAVCSPSRTSWLTSRHPPTTNIYDLYSYFRTVSNGTGHNISSLPEFFRDSGYLSVGMGKIFHPGHASGAVPGCSTCGDDQEYSWSLPYFHAPNLGYWSGTTPKDNRYRGGDSWAFVPPEVEEQFPLPDNQTVDHAIETLKQLKANGTDKWFMAVGFHKPHLPFISPEYFSTLYPADSIQLPTNEYPPSDMPPVAWSSYGETRSYADQAALNATGQPGTKLPDWDTLNLRRAYYSAVSYTDANIGRVLDALEELGLAENTIISGITDHGWKLGEHSNWDKHTNWQLDTHIAMWVYDPDLNAKGGVVTEQRVEAVDLFPTLAQLATGTVIPTCPEDANESQKTSLCTEGTSLVPLWTSPDKPIRQSAFSVYPRGYQKYPYHPNATADLTGLVTTAAAADEAASLASKPSPSACLTKTCTMGYSISTEYEGVEYRFTLWADFELNTPNFDRVVGMELYDHSADPGENVNLAYKSAHEATVAALTERVKGGWLDSLKNA